MEPLSLITLLVIGLFLLKNFDQSQRIALLGRHLGAYPVEALMKELSEGYARALGETDPARQLQIWHLLASKEAELSSQFSRFAAEFAKVDAARTRVSRLPWAVPLATRLFPAITFDGRRALSIHAQGLSNAARQTASGSDTGQAAKDRAYTLSAEMLLMQHTCHWFCRSKGTASVRMLARHQTTYAQLVAAVAPETRVAYRALVG